ncbi:4Fe-4S binding protein [Desulfurococcus mucosus]|uniref:4Fe-4S ferredoxin, iron-sulfur binding domain protein n=1 Tax=Desulfurococcus mucosus (strain ATCC 35584 / DSM 2162 / JCM 9187 / O7/1) TaxID=765177 RepID=E8R9V4_DESM0|nr:4Fe-4S binding protein [Desulfurococcus mucosus]ADV65280.1 4Fe-4S ferredoxin, iron-sulfur binding domain protein [Desulfurococcus mucosus DSM 2162]
MSSRKTGVITPEELEEKGLLPPRERLAKGPVAVLECPEEIPCNICVSACPFNAVSKSKIYEIPKLDPEKCIGCGVCVAKCPGLAIFVVDISKPGKAYVTLPYEMLPAPFKGARVELLDREGRSLGEGTVVKAWSYERTWAVTVEVPPDKWLSVRAIRVKR